LLLRKNINYDYRYLTLLQEQRNINMQ